MRINNNVTAMNAHRMYSNNNSKVTKSVSKLSSGYRINSAADDAAGLAISEKMRAQIRGLSMASKNSQDAVSLVQTAEGALQETHNILQRMRELAVQSASDTNETSIDRSALDAEFQQLKKEIDDIAGTTRFNDQNLIDGTFSKYNATAELTDTDGISQALVGDAKHGSYALSAYTRAVGSEAGAAPTESINVDGANNVASAVFDPGTLFEGLTTEFNKDFTLEFNEVSDGDGTNPGTAYFTLRAQDGSSFTGSATISTTASGGTIDIKFGEVGTIQVTLTSGITISDNTSVEDAAKEFEGLVFTGMGGKNKVDGTTKAFVKLGDEEVEVKAGDTEVEFRSAGVILKLEEAISQADVDDENNTELASKITGTIDVTLTKGKSLVIQTGANEGDNLAINLDRMDTKTLGIYTTDISSRETASNSITYVNAALNKVSTQRAELGALQNRMEHKIANLDTSAENLQAAESRIRDVDMASEMTTFTKNNILSQASTAMLAQANSLPQGVLQLLG